MLRPHEDIAVFPKRIVRSSLQTDLEILKHNDLQIGLSEEKLLQMKKGDYIILDFGRELAGSIRLLSYTGGKVRIRLGESVTESSADLGEKSACNDHSIRDIQIDLPFLSDNCYLQSAFRFVRIDALSDVALKAVLAMEERAILLQKGYFRSDDEKVNSIFDTAAETLRLCIRDYIWDGVKRDRLVWIGDMHPETLGVLSLFGAEETVEKSLDFVRIHTPIPGWMNNLATYSMWWIIILADYFKASGKRDFLLKQKEYLVNLIKFLDENLSEKGDFLFKDYLFDWPTHETEEEDFGVHALFLLALKKAKEIFVELEVDVSVCEKTEQKLMKRKVKLSKAKQCAAMQVYAGLFSAQEAAGLLVKNGAKGLSTFMSYYILWAISQSGKTDAAIKIMKEYYGKMLDLGATTFWEDFDIEWAENACSIDRFPKKGERDIHGDFGAYCYKGFRHSLCHGWSCGPVGFLLNKVAGFCLEDAGKKMILSPDLGSLNYVEAGYPTPYGIVEIIAKRKEDGSILLTYNAPNEICVITKI